MEIIKIQKERIEDKAILALVANNFISIDVTNIQVDNDVLEVVKNQLKRYKIGYKIRSSAKDGFSDIIFCYPYYCKYEYSKEDMSQYIVIYEDRRDYNITVTHMSNAYKQTLAQQQSISDGFRNSLVGGINLEK